MRIEYVNPNIGENKMAENRLNITSPAFLEILAEEDRLRKLKDRFPLQSPAWHSVWNKLEIILKRKKAYENKVERNRMFGR